MKSDLLLPELKPIEWLKPYEKNAKKHPPEQVKRLAATIKAHGWDQPIVAWTDGTIIKGHGRRLAAIELGLTHIPVVIRSDLTKAEADALRIADNAATSVQYDTEIMKEELARLMREVPSIDVDSLALTGKELDFLTNALDTPEITAIMEDTTAEIEAAKAEDKARVEKADEELIPVGNALGFKRLKAADQRTVTSFMAEAEAATGKEGAEAFLAALKIAMAKGLD